MLLSSFINLFGQSDGTLPSTGELLKADTAVATIPIYLIKEANVKLIERKYLIEINNQQDSIIDLKDKYIKEQYTIIEDFKNKINKTNKTNIKLKEALDFKQRNNNFVIIGSSSIILGLIIGIICK